VVLNKEFLPGDAAIMIPHTDDGRVLFAVPWHQKIIVGTTDTSVSEIREEPVALKDELDFIMHHAARYLTKDPATSDIKSIFAGLRPLVKSSAKKTAEISRDHSIIVSESGLVSIVGGKWTTYRKMSEDVINTAAIQAGLPYRECVTEQLAIHGSQPTADFNSNTYYLGTDQSLLQALIKENPELGEKIHPDLPYSKAAIVLAIREEMCMTLEDALSRRTRSLLLDARAAISCAESVARLMAKEMGRDTEWISKQLISFNQMARHYLPDQY
jgi:glycerol-3-phosphate dehydrogenase